MNSDADTAKAILAYADLQADQLYYEFMREVYLEKTSPIKREWDKRHLGTDHWSKEAQDGRKPSEHSS